MHVDDLLGEGALVHLRQQRPPGVLGLVAQPVGRGHHGVHDDLVAVVVDAGGVAPEDHRQPVRGQPHATQAPQVVVVQARGPHVHPRPAVGHLGLGPLPHLQTAQRVVGGLAGGVDGEHGSHPIRGRSQRPPRTSDLRAPSSPVSLRT